MQLPHYLPCLSNNLAVGSETPAHSDINELTKVVSKRNFADRVEREVGEERLYESAKQMIPNSMK
jgi:hypothetical protein